MHLTDVVRHDPNDAPDMGGVHPGTVTRIDGITVAWPPPVVWVEVPTIAPGHQYGPAPIPIHYRSWDNTAHRWVLPFTVGSRCVALLHPAGHHLLTVY